MKNLDPNKVGVILGIILGGFHFCWTILIFLGWAQPIIDFVFSLHMISPFINVLAFDMTTAAELVIFTFTVGYCIGYTGAVIWNMVHKK